MGKTRQRWLSVTIAATLTSAAGCSTIMPPPPDPDTLRKTLAEDQGRMYGAQEPVTAPITFYDAVARALKYNLDYRLKLMESALARNLRDVSNNEMLPQLVASAGYGGRSNDSGGTSIGIEDRQVSLRPSTSEERYHRVGALGFSWSVLDFGVAYYRAQQKSDEVAMAEERRRKVAQNVLQDVRNAYWRAIAAQQLQPQVDQLLERTRRALASAREAETRGLLPRMEILSYQRALLDSIYLLSVRRQDLEFAQAELAALMSLPPGSRLWLADAAQPGLPQLNDDVAKLEQLSLENRPEVREDWYQKRIDLNDIRIAKAHLWPNIGVTAGYDYDDNKYLYNSDWTSTGVQVSLNLFNFLKWPDVYAAQDTQTALADTRRVALSMAILTQTRVGAIRYQLARQEVEFADESLRVDRSLRDYARAAKTTSLGTELEMIRAEGRYLLSRYEREAAYSSAQAAWGRLYNSIGLDILPDTIASHDIATIAKEIEATLTRQEQQGLLAGSGNVAR
ncbi:MAG TPA: TolC family protein [Povalibacter sp.]|uniref:TolC family protein n=1 Tax=Povalibacter sp. TaxID=1962978 RepID=UPI002CDE52D6|nr:TolC family protein [Povalibacter sp.]HMN43340.1 TolC family protein [Povalibacter sp.]